LAIEGNFSIVHGIDTPLTLNDYTKNKSRGFFSRILVDVDLLSELSNQILVETQDLHFITNVEYEKLSLFCSNRKTIGHDLSNYRRSIQDVKANFGGEKTIGAKIQQRYHLKGDIVSQDSVLVAQSIMVVQPVLEPIGQPQWSWAKLVVEPVVQLSV